MAVLRIYQHRSPPTWFMDGICLLNNDLLPPIPLSEKNVPLLQREKNVVLVQQPPLHRLTLLLPTPVKPVVVADEEEEAAVGKSVPDRRPPGSVEGTTENAGFVQ